MTSLLEAKGLTIRYSSPRGEIRAAEDVDLEVGAGEIVGLAGESGSGKTTLALGMMRVLPRQGRVAAGEVRFQGNDVLALSDERFRKEYRWTKMSMVFQGSMNGFTPVFTIGSQIDEVMRIHGKRGGETEVNRLLRMVDLDEGTAGRYPHELSGGQRQRAFIAMALALEPRLVLADEPTTALDVITQANILNLLKRLRKETGVSILLITHDLALISQAADRLYVMYAGRVVERGRSEDLLRAPKHPYTQGLLAATTTMESTEVRGIPGFMPDLARLGEGCSFHPRCPRVMDVCRRERPDLRGAGGEGVACWLY